MNNWHFFESKSRAYRDVILMQKKLQIVIKTKMNNLYFFENGSIVDTEIKLLKNNLEKITIRD